MPNNSTLISLRMIEIIQERSEITILVFDLLFFLLIPTLTFLQLRSLASSIVISRCVDGRVKTFIIFRNCALGLEKIISQFYFKFESLIFRNQILCCWNENPQSEVTKEAAAKNITKIEYQDINLINGIWCFLQRRGTINHGDFKIQQKMPQNDQKHIAIIGGGISGEFRCNNVDFRQQVLFFLQHLLNKALSQNFIIVDLAHIIFCFGQNYLFAYTV